MKTTVDPKSFGKKLTKKKLGNYIQSVYGRLAENKVINVMDIGKVFRMAEEAYATMGTLEAVDAALTEAVTLYCKEYPS